METFQIDRVQVLHKPNPEHVLVSNELQDVKALLMALSREPKPLSLLHA